MRHFLDYFSKIFAVCKHENILKDDDKNDEKFFKEKHFLFTTNIKENIKYVKKWYGKSKRITSIKIIYIRLMTYELKGRKNK